MLKYNLPSGPCEAVHVGGEEGDVDAEAGRQGRFHVGLAFALRVLQQPQVGDAGVVDVALRARTPAPMPSAAR